MQNSRQSSTTDQNRKNRRKETVLLVVVALFGIAGLLALQLSQSNPEAVRSDRSLLQSNAETGSAAGSGQAAAPIQRIPGNLIRENEQPEAGRPFLFELANHSQGAVYELDLGDGARKAFANGQLRHTYHKPGAYQVTLFARYEGEEIPLQTVTKVVAQTVREEKAITPIIDY